MGWLGWKRKTKQTTTEKTNIKSSDRTCSEAVPSNRRAHARHEAFWLGWCCTWHTLIMMESCKPIGIQVVASSQWKMVKRRLISTQIWSSSMFERNRLLKRFNYLLRFGPGSRISIKPFGRVTECLPGGSVVGYSQCAVMSRVCY